MINFDNDSMAEYFENDDMHESLLLYKVLLGILASLMIRIIFPIQAQAVGAFPPPGLQKLTSEAGSSGPGLKSVYKKCQGTGCLQNRYYAQEPTVQHPTVS